MSSKSREAYKAFTGVNGPTPEDLRHWAELKLNHAKKLIAEALTELAKASEMERK